MHLLADRPDLELTAPWSDRKHDDELIGRETELSRVLAQLRTHRVVTVTGPGGVGKTTLALAAVELTESSTIVCELADLVTEEAVRPTVAHLLGVELMAGQSLSRALRSTAAESEGADLLVVLDNCEHVLDAAAAVAADLATVGPRVRVLATSREPLGLQGEQVLPLGPLPVPRPGEAGVGSPAVALFVARAAAASGELPLDQPSLAAVVRICRALDGLPLALEIVAARTRSMSVHDLAGRLARPWLLLRASTRGRPRRHQSLRAVFDWSWDLLSTAERGLLAALSICPGGADLAAATTAGAAVDLDDTAVLDVLDGLVAKSLLTVDRAHGGTRYVMPQTLRTYGVERLEGAGRLAEAHDRHASHFADVARAARAAAVSSWSPETFAAFVGDLDNVRAALAWTLARDERPDRTFELLAPLWFHCHLQGAEEIVALTDRALARWPEPSHPLWSEVAATAAEAAAGVDRLDLTVTRGREAVKAATSPVGEAHAWRILAEVSAFLEGDPEQALAQLQSATEAAARGGYEQFVGDLISLRAELLGQSGRVREAVEAAGAALSHARSRCDRVTEVRSRQIIGVALADEDPGAARTWLRAAYEAADSADLDYFAGSAVRGLGSVAAVEGDIVTAAELFIDATDRFDRLGCVVERWTTLAAILPLLVRTGRVRAARTMLHGIDTAGVFVKRLQAPGYAGVREQLEDTVASVSGPSDLSLLELVDLFALARDELRAITGRDRSSRGESQRGETVPAPGSGPRASAVAGLVRQGDLWVLSYEGTEAHVPNLKGLHDLAVLLAQPGREIAALDLAAGPVAAERGSSAWQDDVTSQPGDLGEQLDATARAAYAARLRELQAELEAADEAGDADRGARAQAEMDFVTRELSAAYGLHGPRRSGDPAEKARAAVTARIRAAIVKIRGVHPRLGSHLRASVRTGRFCGYQPDEPVDWTVRR